MHISPSVQETIALQQRGWKLDAALPGAYLNDIVTQQWSLDIAGEDFMRMMRVKQQLLNMIKQERKTLEVRVAYDSIKTIVKGDRINLATRTDSQVIRVNDVRRYTTFEEMLEAEQPSRIVPGLSKPDVLRLLREIYPPQRESLGVIVLDIQTEK